MYGIISGVGRCSVCKEQGCVSNHNKYKQMWEDFYDTRKQCILCFQLIIHGELFMHHESCWMPYRKNGGMEQTQKEMNDFKVLRDPV